MPRYQLNKSNSAPNTHRSSHSVPAVHALSTALAPGNHIVIANICLHCICPAHIYIQIYSCTDIPHILDSYQCTTFHQVALFYVMVVKCCWLCLCVYLDVMTYPTSFVEEIQHFECEQTQHFAKEHCTRLHKRMLELTRLAVDANGFGDVRPSIWMMIK